MLCPSLSHVGIKGAAIVGIATVIVLRVGWGIVYWKRIKQGEESQDESMAVEVAMDQVIGVIPQWSRLSLTSAREELGENGQCEDEGNDVIGICPKVHMKVNYCVYFTFRFTRWN